MCVPPGVVVHLLPLLLWLFHPVHGHHLHLSVESARSLSAASNLSCTVLFSDLAQSRTLANQSFVCAKQALQIPLHGPLTYPLLLVLSAWTSTDGAAIYTGLMSFSRRDMGRDTEHVMTNNDVSVAFRLSLVCEADLVGPYCNVSCPPPTTFDHYQCTPEGKVCNKGWRQPDCAVPLCQCAPHGRCVAPGVCRCASGWSGERCAQCEPRAGCVHGDCAGRPGTCKCRAGYRGLLCDRHVSSECVLEGCVRGQCGFVQQKRVCYCDRGFAGVNCTERLVPSSAPALPSTTPPTTTTAQAAIRLDTMVTLVSCALLALVVLLVLKKLLDYNRLVLHTVSLSPLAADQTESAPPDQMSPQSKANLLLTLRPSPPPPYRQTV